MCADQHSARQQGIAAGHWGDGLRVKSWSPAALTMRWLLGVAVLLAEVGVASGRGMNGALTLPSRLPALLFTLCACVRVCACV